MAPQAKLTPLQESEARRLAEQQARDNKVQKNYSDEEKATRKERVAEMAEFWRFMKASRKSLPPGSIRTP